MTESAQSITSSEEARLLWSPDKPQDSLLWSFMKQAEEQSGLSFAGFGDLAAWSSSHLEEFWSLAWDACGMIGDKAGPAFRQIEEVPFARFFPEAKINYAENILAGVADDSDAPAIIYRLQDSSERTLSRQDLYDAVSRWAQALEAAGVREGDRVAVYMPNVPETVIILLAANVLGAVFASAGMEMGPSDLINRFSQVKPKVLITAEGYTHGAKHISRLDVVERVQNEIDTIEKTVVLSLQSEEPARDFLAGFEPQTIDFVRRDFNHPLYILFSSGSTGKPKCFEHSAGGVLLKHLVEYQLHCDVKPGDAVFYHATPSWMMWNWLVSGLACGASILMYDGSPAYPDAYAQWRFTSDHGCTHHGSAAPLILSWADNALEIGKECDVTALRCVMSTGAVLPAQGFEYIHDHIKQDVKIGSISGGTDLVGCFVGGNAFAPTYAGQINGPILGCDIQVWDDAGKPCAPGEAGELVCTTPFPSMPLRFLDDPDGQRYYDEYFSHYEGQKVWRHGDSIEKTAQGQFRIIGRSDATLNQNGVRIGAIAIYDQLAPFMDRIAGYAAVDFTRPDNQQAITVLFMQLADDAEQVPEDLQKDIRNAVKNNVTPYAIPTEIIAVPGVLKTPNGKTAEVVMKKILAGKDIPNASLYGEDLVRRFEEIGANLRTKYGG